MSNLSDELELALEQVVEERIKYGHYGRMHKSTVREYITQDFAEWLVKKFEEEKYNATSR
jgi:hypothetical protein